MAVALVAVLAIIAASCTSAEDDPIPTPDTQRDLGGSGAPATVPGEDHNDTSGSGNN